MSGACACGVVHEPVVIRDHLIVELHRLANEDFDWADAEWFADHLLPVVLRYGLDKAAEELRAIGRAGLAATPGPHPVRVPVGYLFDRADALTAQDPT